jgi:GT2 family glycosyltransferase
MFPESRLLNPRAYPGWLRDSEREVDIVTGCLFLIERSFWNELGGFDPRFFMFGEEAELCARAQAAGAHPMITPHATIIHYDGASNRDPLQKAIFQLQATLRVVDLHMRGTERSVARAATIGGVALRKAVFRIAARVAPARWRNRAREWAGIWARRAEWRDGPLTRL